MLTETQIQNRKKGVGASEAAIVMGLDKEISPYQLWLIKTGRAEPKDLSEVPQVRWGQILEDVIANEYAKVRDCELEIVPETLYHKEYPFMLCHLDRKIKGLRKHIECKYAMFARDEWGPSESDIVPLKYIVQVQHQLAITEHEAADIPVLIGGYDFRIYHFKPNQEIIGKIIEEVSQFWWCVENDVAPPLRDRTDVELAYPFSNGNFKEADPNILKVIDEYDDVSEQAKIFEEKKDNLRNKLSFFIKDADGIKNNAMPLFTYKPTVRGNRVLRRVEARV